MLSLTEGLLSATTRASFKKQRVHPCSGEAAAASYPCRPSRPVRTGPTHAATAPTACRLLAIPALQAATQSAAAAAEAEAQAMASQNAALQDEVSRLRQSLQAASAAAGSAAKPKGGWVGRRALGAEAGSGCFHWLTRRRRAPALGSVQLVMRAEQRSRSRCNVSAASRRLLAGWR